MLELGWLPSLLAGADQTLLKYLVQHGAYGVGKRQIN